MDSLERRVIGWKEYIDFIDWQIAHVKTKVDTGARTSALGVDSYTLDRDERGLTAELTLALHRHHPDRRALIRVPVLRLIVVRNSSGQIEQRPLIETTVRLGAVVKRIRLTVTRRAGMRFPMLLGRKALEGDFIVDVSKKYLLRRKGIAN